MASGCVVCWRAPALAVAALLAWPRVRLDPSPDGAGAHRRCRASRVASRRSRPLGEQADRCRCSCGREACSRRGTLAAGERLTVELTVRRPGWAGWLVGHTATRTFTVETPVAHLSEPVAAGEDGLAGGGLLRPAGQSRRVQATAGRGALASPQRGRAGRGRRARLATAQGAIAVAAAARSWERLSPAARVTLVPGAAVRAAARGAAGRASRSRPGAQLRLTFSDTGAGRCSARLARSSCRRLPGAGGCVDAHTLVFRPTGARLRRSARRCESCCRRRSGSPASAAA